MTALAVVSFSLGPVNISSGQMLALICQPFGWDIGDSDYSPYNQDTLSSVLWSIRLPRVILAIMAGAALAIAGAGMQGLFRNPLADPSIIGVSAGAAVGAVCAIVLGGSVAGWTINWLGSGAIPLFAFLGSLTATGMVYRFSKMDGRLMVATMLLSGIAINALGGACVGFLVFISDYQQLRDFTFWSLGSLSSASWESVRVAALFIILPILIYPFHARALNVFLLGEAEARHLGVDTDKTKLMIVVLNAAMVGATVSLCGIITFIGLVVPHLTRLCIGPDHRFLIPGSAFMGGILLLSADLFSRLIIHPAELPIGIVTALFGAPFFLGLLQLSRQPAYE